MSDIGTVDPATDPVLTPPPEPPAVDPAPSPDPAPEPTPRTVPLETFTREVTPLRAKVRDLELAREEDSRKLREANELLARLQRNGSDPAAPPAPPAAAPRPSADASEIERAAAELNFRRDSQAIIGAGLQAYGQQAWQDSVNILESFGLNSAEFVSSIMDVAGRDKAHEVVHSLAQDPGTVAALRNMSASRRAVEIARIADKMNTKPAAQSSAEPPPPPARTVSRAPPPAPPIQPNASKITDWRSDKASDEEFSKGWNERYVKGGGIRR